MLEARNEGSQERTGVPWSDPPYSTPIIRFPDCSSFCSSLEVMTVFSCAYDLQTVLNIASDWHQCTYASIDPLISTELSTSMQVLLNTWAAPASLTREFTESNVCLTSAVLTGFLS
jgi:hypothetical protein